MSLNVELSPAMPSRPCLFCLCLQEGSVFADFDIDPSDRVYLRRISFDGFGCRDTGVSLGTMDADDSLNVLAALASQSLADPHIGEILQKLFREHQHAIGAEALKEHGLV